MYQKLIIVGNLGQDPEMRRTPDGTPVTSFSVATNKRWTTSDGQQGEKTVWFRVTAWRRLAEACAQYLHKGDPVLVEGELSEPRVYQTKASDEWRASLDLTAYTVKFLGGRSDDVPKTGTNVPEMGTVETDAPSAGASETVADDEVPF